MTKRNSRSRSHNYARFNHKETQRLYRLGTRKRICCLKATASAHNRVNAQFRRTAFRFATRTTGPRRPRKKCESEQRRSIDAVATSERRAQIRVDWNAAQVRSAPYFFSGTASCSSSSPPRSSNGRTLKYQFDQSFRAFSRHGVAKRRRSSGDALAI